MGTVKEMRYKGANLILVIAAKKLLSGRKHGDSIAVDGTCLTVTKKTAGQFAAEVMPETIQKTIVGNYKKGQRVNLETPLKLGDSLDGHFLLGHVDGKGKVEKFTQDEKGAVLTVGCSRDLAKYIAMKGSVAINGVSLTVSRVIRDAFQVSLIPTTLKLTNLGNLQPGDEVNLEIDVLARYIERLNQFKS